MIINPKIKNIFDFKFDDFILVDYDPHPHIERKSCRMKRELLCLALDWLAVL